MKMIWQKSVSICIANGARMQTVFLEKKGKVFIFSKELIVTDRMIKEMVQFIALERDVIVTHS